MSLSTFPSLSKAMAYKPYSWGYVQDPTLRDKTLDGRRDCRDAGIVRLRWFRIFYPHLTYAADEPLLKTFEETTVNFGSTAFYYHHAILYETLTVRFGEPIEYIGAGPATFDAEIYLVEDPNDFGL